MIERNISTFNNIDKNKRDFVDDISKFINGTEHLEGRVLVLHGLRRTGKTVAIEQALSEYARPEECAFYEVTDKDDMDDIYRTVIEAKQLGKKLICFDEITKADGFINDSAGLSDVFAKEDIKIILAGTDSLSFVFAGDHELFDRTVNIRTTHIPFAEHCRVLGIRDIDDYIEFGGLMRQGKKIVHDYLSACKYLDEAVADNISNSIKKDVYGDELPDITKEELRTIIEKLVEQYSGKITLKAIISPLRKVSVNEPINKLQDIVDASVINRIYYNSEKFAEVINASGAIRADITDQIILKLERYLMDMDVLSSTLEETFRFDETGWHADVPQYEYHIIQPAIKYYHLQKGKEFIEKESFYDGLSNKGKKLLEDKLDEKIKGDMTEQIILFDTRHALPKNEYQVSKPVFYINGQRKGEYDMLVWHSSADAYYSFEIKHTKNPYFEQEKHLVNEELKTKADRQYGIHIASAVLYRGISFQNATGVFYINITDFCLAVEKYKDMKKAMDELTEELPIIDLKKYNKLQEANAALEIAPIAEISYMERVWNEYFSKPQEERNGIEWNGEKIRLAVFEDKYIAKCQELNTDPDSQ